MHIGKKIKVVRIYKGISQEELADKIDRTRALVAHIEQSGKVNTNTLENIIRVLGVTKDELENFGEKSYTDPAELEAMQNKLNMLEERLQNYQNENKILKELLQSQKKIISMYEKKSTDE